MSPTRLGFCFLVIGIFLSLSSSAQKYKKALDKANVLYYEKRYGEAYVAYKQIYQKNQDDKELLLKMADANFMLPNYAVAQDYYAQYFSDTIYKDIEQFSNYALASKQLGKVKLAAKLYQKIYESKQDSAAKKAYELFKVYADSADLIRSYYLDSNYTCIVIDARESVDTAAMPMVYIWDFGDRGKMEGEQVEHCFGKSGWNKISLSVRDKNTGVVHVNDTALYVYIEVPPVKFKTTPTKSGVTMSSKRSGLQYQDVIFDAGETVMNDYTILDYVWDFGNGDTKRGESVRYKYNNKDIYKIKLYVIAEDKNGAKRLFSSYRMLEIVDNLER